MNNFTSDSYMFDLLKKIAETESPTHNKAAVDAVGALVGEECQKLGGQVEVHPQTEAGNHIVARWGAGTNILILCHMDTVYPIGTLAKMPFYEKDGKIYGPGVLDMKAGIVIALAAIRALAGSGIAESRSITVCFTSDEEVGSVSSRNLIETLARQAELVLVMEPGMLDGALKTWRKGVGDYVLKVTGRAAHAGGNHDEGRNAIEEIAHQVIAIQQLTDYSKGTTVNVGMIKGGMAANVVPDEASIEIDMRVLQPGEAERIDAALRNLKPVLQGTSITVTGELNRPPLPFNEVNQAAFKKASQIALEIGLELKAGGTGGGSDGNFIAPLGIPVLDGMGAVGEGLHSEREYLFTASLAERAHLLTLLLEKW